MFQPEDDLLHSMTAVFGRWNCQGGLIKRKKWDNIQIQQKEEKIMYTTVIDKSLDLKKSPEVMAL